RGRIALPERDPDPRLGGIPRGDTHEGLADVHSDDAVRAELGKLNRQEPRAGGDLQHVAAARHPPDDFLGRSLEFLDVPSRVPGIPAGDQPLHRQAPVRLLRLRCAHGVLPWHVSLSDSPCVIRWTAAPFLTGHEAPLNSSPWWAFIAASTRRATAWPS